MELGPSTFFILGFSLEPVRLQPELLKWQFFNLSWSISDLVYAFTRGEDNDTQRRLD
jgi:hypothetical protein